MLTLFTVNVSASANTTKDLIIGDVNGDGKTDSIDITEIKNYLLGIIKDFSYIHGLDAADVNGDGNVNTIDYVIYSKFLLGVITEFRELIPIPTPHQLYTNPLRSGRSGD